MQIFFEMHQTRRKIAAPWASARARDIFFFKIPCLRRCRCCCSSKRCSGLRLAVVSSKVLVYRRSRFPSCFLLGGEEGDMSEARQCFWPKGWWPEAGRQKLCAYTFLLSSAMNLLIGTASPRVNVDNASLICLSLRTPNSRK